MSENEDAGKDKLMREFLKKYINAYFNRMRESSGSYERGIQAIYEVNKSRYSMDDIRSIEGRLMEKENE